MFQKLKYISKFTKGSSVSKDISKYFSMKGEEITKQKEGKYLGVKVDSKPHISITCTIITYTGLAYPKYTRTLLP